MSQPATVFYDAAEAARSCVCAQMEAMGEDIETYPGCPCLTYVSAGEPVIDCCSEARCKGTHGMLTAHVETVFPSDNFPLPSEGFAPCKAATWVALVVVTAARCAPTLDAQGKSAKAGKLDASGLLMALDQYAIVTALSCCLVEDALPGKRKRRVQLLESRPNVDEGGCASVEVRAYVEAGSVCSCAPPGS